MIHSMYMIGRYWRNINNNKHREEYTTCNTTESMDHILTKCREKTMQLTWALTQNLWPHDNTPWLDINLGTILGYGCISLLSTQR